MSLSSDDLDIQISGNTRVTAVNGIYTFKEIEIVGKPDYMSKLKFFSSSLNEDKIMQISNKTSCNNSYFLTNYWYSFVIESVLQTLYSR